MSIKTTEELRQCAIEDGHDPDKVECWHCMDGACYPDYGMAPHRHVGENIIGSTQTEPQSEWPDNFEPDWDGIHESERANYTGPMQGLWYCPKDCEHGGITKNKPRIPNETTAQVFKDSDAGENLHEYSSAEELFEDLGI